MIDAIHTKPGAQLKMTILSVLAVSLISGCGIRGPLKTPPPVFGGDAKVDPDRVPEGDLDRDSSQDDDIFGNDDTFGDDEILSEL